MKRNIAIDAVPSCRVEPTVYRSYVVCSLLWAGGSFTPRFDARGGLASPDQHGLLPHLGDMLNSAFNATFSKELCPIEVAVTATCRSRGALCGSTSRIAAASSESAKQDVRCSYE
jgi:hypothetical protein